MSVVIFGLKALAVFLAAWLALLLGPFVAIAVFLVGVIGFVLAIVAVAWVCAKFS